MLQAEIERLFEEKPEKYTEEHFRLFQRFKDALNQGRVRAAEPDPSSPSGWRVNAWVKKGILLGFRMGAMIEMGQGAAGQPLFDKATWPLKRLRVEDGVRVVPGGSAIRDGCYVGRGVTCMPPMYINAGAWVGEGTMVDSHALVGSCAQVGKRVHLSAASQIGGVLEPVGALPVIIEDDVFIGGNCGVYEGTIVKRGAVLAAGVILTSGTRVYDVVQNTIHQKTEQHPLTIPANAVVVPGSRPVSGDWAQEHGLQIFTPLIIKYRDEKTSAATALEEGLR